MDSQPNTQKTVVIDARDHVAGRLAATVAKELLAGQRVVRIIF